MMKKLMTLVVVIMLIAAMATVARSGDKYKLKDIIQWQNTIYLTGISDTSLNRSNENDPSENHVVNNGIPKKQSAHYINHEGTTGIVGMGLVDEFRCKLSLPKIVFFNDAIKFNVGLEQRLVLAFSNQGKPFWGGVDLDDSQYRSYLKTGFTFGGSPVKYNLDMNIQMRMAFNGNGVGNMRAIPYLGNKITIAKMLEIRVNSEDTFRWDQGGSTRIDLNADFRIGSPGQAGGGYHYLKGAIKRANGYNIGPISLGWRIRTRINVGLRQNRWKDTDPGGALTSTAPGADKNTYLHVTDSVNGDGATFGSGDQWKGMGNDWKFRSSEEIWINPIKSVDKIDLNIGGDHFIQIWGSYSYNWPDSIAILNDVRAGCELVLDKAFIIGLFFRVRTLDFANSWGIPLNGDVGQTGVWATANPDGWAAIEKGGILQGDDGEYYATIPQGNGQIGPLVYVGVKKDAFEWFLQYQGFANVRTYDVYGTNFVDNPKTVANEEIWDSTKNFGADSMGYYDWRNEIETFVTWYW